MTPVKQISKTQATTLTKRIRESVDSAWTLLLEAHEGRAWAALGYDSWEKYVKAEFGIGRSRSYQLLDQGRVIKAVTEAAGEMSTKVDIGERQVREIKAELKSVTSEIKDRVAKGEEPAKAAESAVAAAKEKKKAAQAEHDRQRDASREALPEAVKQQQATKAQAIAGRQARSDERDDRVAELEETVRALEAEKTELKARVDALEPMRIEYERGGFAEVIKGLTEQIKGLKTRVASESQQKVKNLNAAEYWKKKAVEYGYSKNTVIDIESGEEVNG